MKLICIKCTFGCNLTATKVKGEVVVKGNRCPMGAIYAKEELTCPKRTVTSVVNTNVGMRSVKTDKDVDIRKIDEVLAAIAKVKVKNPKYHDIIIKGVAGTDANVIITSSTDCK